MTPKDIEPKQTKRKRKRKKTKHQQQPLSFSSLPNEIVENCLARISRWTYPLLSTVSKSFLSVLSSPELYTTRSQIGNTEQFLYFCLDLPDYPSPKWFTLSMKPTNKTLTHVGFDLRDDEYRLGSVPSLPYRYHVPLDSIVAVGPEIYLIGPYYKWMPPSSTVLILDCRSHTLRDGPKMLVARVGADVVFLDGKIYVMGGCESTNTWMEVLDVKTQTWKPSSSHVTPDLISSIRHLTNVIKGKIHVISAKKDYAYEPKKDTWEVMETQLVSFMMRAWCVIEDVIYCYTYSGYFMWYDFDNQIWRKVKGQDLKLLRKNCIWGLEAGGTCLVIKMVNYGGKLLVIWVPSFQINKTRRIWCANIALEKRLRGEIWGKIEWANSVFTVPSLFKFLCCVATSI